jgi:predicted DNA-binding transcriptional regulator AlpA
MQSSSVSQTGRAKPGRVGKVLATKPADPAPEKALIRLPETGFLRLRQVQAFVPFSAATMWRQVKEGRFPGPIKLSAGVTAWRAEDVRRWIGEQG